jgi:sialate O-acetylesterase
VAYGEKLVYEGPLFASVKFKKDRAIVRFKNITGRLVARDGSLKGFTLAGKNQKFYRAKAQIKGDSVMVSSPEVSQPIAVRYGWADYPDVNLYNGANLPASPFRTDEFPLTQSPPAR